MMLFLIAAYAHAQRTVSSWNISDVMDDAEGYYRGPGWYSKKIYLPASTKGKQIYFLFEGVNQRGTVFINGNKATEHIGGYTAFTVNATELLHWNKENELLVKVDNSYDANIPPLTADFSFYGGIYR